MLQRIGRYEVLGEIARGGMGAVLRARDPQLGRDVAIKVLTAGSAASEAARRRFSVEGRALGRLKHPNIVAVHETGQVRDWPYIVMDFIDGESLDARLERDGPLPVDEAIAVAATVARALVHAHQEGIVHRDLKPGNVLLGRDGVVRLGDFGLAKDLLGSADVAGGMTRSGVFLGTPGFLPPEQAMGRRREVGPASDVYGLGATLYAALTGVAPYEAEEIVTLVALMHMPPKPPSAHRPGIPAALDALVLRCLRTSPGDRPASVAAVADELEALRGARPASSQARRGARARPRSNAPALAGGLAIVAAGVAVAVALVARSRPPTPPPLPAPPPAPTTTTTTTEPPATEAAVVVTSDATAPVSTEPPVDPLVAEARADLLAGRFDHALVLAERHVAASPGEPEALVLRGDARLGVGDTTGAIKDWTKALALDPDPATAWRRALARQTLEDHDGVIEDCGRVLSLLGPKREVLELRAASRAKRGDVDGALQDWTDAIGILPTARAFLEVAKLEFDQGHLEIALRDYTLASKLDPDDVTARVNVSVTLQLLGRLDEAEAEATKAIEHLPESGYTWVRRAAVRLAQERWADALGDYDKASAHGLRDDLVVLLDRSMVLRKLGRHDDAIRDARRAIEVAPTRITAHERLIGALTDVGKYPEARDHLDRVIAELPPSAALHFLRGVVRDELKDVDGALADYRTSLELDPDQSAPHYNSGILLAQRGDHAAARDAYTKAIEHGPETNYYLNRAEERRHLGDPAGALDDVNEALKLEPKSVMALGARAVLHTRAGRYADARPDWDALVALEPTNTVFLYNRGICFEVLSEKALARADYEKIIELSGADSVKTKQARARLANLEKNGPPPRVTFEGDPPRPTTEAPPAPPPPPPG